MQKRRNIQLKASDVIVTVICLLGVYISLLTFVEKLNSSLSRDNELPIGTITYKYKSAQRQFIDRVLWDRLKQESPVYNGDKIRTASLAEATISFNDGNTVVLYENTLIQVFSEEKGLNLDFSQGDVALATSEEGSSMRLSTPISSVQVNSNSELYASGKNDLQLIVNEGSAVVGETTLNKGDGQIVDENGVSVNLSRLIMNTPLPNTKILTHSNEQQIVNFEWSLQNISKGVPVILDIAQDKEFKRVVKSISSIKETSYSVSLGGGVYYWRLHIIDGPEIESRLPICVSLKPELITPINNYTFSYRTKNPVVRFMWSPDEYISFWQLEVADNKDFNNCIISQKCTKPSSIISSLGKGTWYWRVKPFYTINSIGFANSSEYGVFEILQNANLTKIELFIPENEGLINTQLESDEKVYFSWKSNSEAVSYEIIIADNKQLKNPIVKDSLYENYYSLDQKKYDLSNENWFWTVNYTDAEGNKSPETEIRTFYAVKGDIIQRTIFPPDGYAINPDRTIDLRYTWKTNVSFDTHYQIAKDSSFNEIVVDEIINQSMVKGKNLSEGEWYWRIIASDDNFSLQTPPKKIRVVPYLAKAIALNPLNKSRCVIRPMTAVIFQWNLVDGADYYQFKLYDKSKTTVLHEKNNLFETSIKLNLDNYADGEYVWTIQAFSLETALADRMKGMLSENQFVLKKIRPIDLVYPENNKFYNGVDAYLNPDTITWAAVEKPATVEFILTDATNEVVMFLEKPEGKILLQPLTEGTYYWTLKGFTYDNLDISAMGRRVFRVGPVEPLRAVVNLKPEDKTLFDLNYFLASRQIDFSWDREVEANAYIFTIYDNEGNEVYSSDLADLENFTLDDLSILDKGQFYWTVEPVMLLDGVIFRRGNTVKTGFDIDLPRIEKTVIKKPGTMYGTN